VEPDAVIGGTWGVAWTEAGGGLDQILKPPWIA
jgi:hypothetical protein